MAKQDVISVEAVVTEALPNCKVTVELSPYDLNNGRIVLRHK